MTIFKSATSNYQGIKCYENKGLLKKIENRFKGYIEVPLNLVDFIKCNNLDMILNNSIIEDKSFEIYNYDKLYQNECKIISDNLEDYITSEEFEELETSEELTERIQEIASDSVNGTEVYQHFIVSEYDVEHYWDKYTDYPIYYSYDLDIYLVGITHFGMSWKYFGTSFKVRQYL